MASNGMSWIQSWQPYFQGSARTRGRSLFTAGAVVKRPAEEGEMVRADVFDQGRYNVVIHGHGSATAADCSCDQGGKGAYCEHIWAVLLSADGQDQDPGANTAAPSFEAANPRLPKARKRSGTRPADQGKEARWESYLTLLRPQRFGATGVGANTSGTQHTLPDQQQIIYVIDTRTSEDQQQLVLRLYYRRPTPTGWSPVRPFKLDADALQQLDAKIDRELCGLLVGSTPPGNPFKQSGGRNDRSSDIFVLPNVGRQLLLERMVATERCCLLPVDSSRMADLLPLRWNPEPWSVWTVGALEPSGLDVTMQLRRGDEHLPLGEPWLVLPGDDGLVVHDDTVSPLDDRGARQWIYQFRTGRSDGSDPANIMVPTEDIAKFLDRLYRMPGLPQLDLPPAVRRPVRDLHPTAHMALVSPEGSADTANSNTKKLIAAEIWFEYDGQRTSPARQENFVAPYDPADAETPTHPPNPVTTATPTTQTAAEPPRPSQTEPLSVIRRDRDFERGLLQILAKLGFRPGPESTDRLVISPEHVPGAVATLINRGWTVTADRNAIRIPAAPKLSVQSGIDWFELKGAVTYETESGHEQVTLPAILKAVRSGQTTITLDDGSVGMLPHRWLADHGLLVDIGLLCDDHIRFETSQAAMLDALVAQQEMVDVDQKFALIRQRLQDFSSIDPIKQPATFKGELRPYQCDGLGWLHFLSQVGLGGILADDMGLGKTIQILAMLDLCYDQNLESPTTNNDEPQSDAPHPTLIIVPSSVLFNWIDEAQRFAPKLRLQAYTGTDRHLLREAFGDHDVVVTSYGLLRRDIDELRHHRFEFVILDEAQAIKNPSSQSAKAARLLDARHKIALTGTPIENHLGDLWSIFEFLNPGMLGSNTSFARLIREASRRTQPIDQDADAPQQPDPRSRAARRKRQTRAHAVQIAQALKPFILRRTKQQVLKDLPPKIEQTLVCQMEPAQRKIYDGLLHHYRRTLLGQADRTASPLAEGSTMMVLEALLRLRQAACHPGLIDQEGRDAPSAKLEVLLDRLGDLVEEGHKALVFSQFTKMLALVKTRLDQKGITYEYLDGQTRDRKKRIERFQNDEDCPVFLISLKAGGLGLNLTAASYVFLLDPWWNPAVEAQAIDRAHRIGQENHVFAYRLICQDTVEQRITELQANKKALADTIVDGQDNLLRSLTRDDLEKLLS